MDQKPQTFIYFFLSITFFFPFLSADSINAPSNMQINRAAFALGTRGFAFVNAPSGAGSACGCVVSQRHSAEILQKSVRKLLRNITVGFSPHSDDNKTVFFLKGALKISDFHDLKKFSKARDLFWTINIM